MLALIKQMIDPEIRPRTATSTMTDRFSGHNAPKFPIIMPSAPKFAKPQMANVVIAALRSYSWREKQNNQIEPDTFRWFLCHRTDRNFAILFQNAQLLVCNKFVDNIFGGNHFADFFAVLPWNAHDISQWDETLPQKPFDGEKIVSNQHSQPTNDRI